MRKFICISAALLLAMCSARAEDPPGGAKTIELKNSKLIYHEHAGGTGINLVHKHGKVIVNIDPKGKPTLHFVQIGNSAHIDLNGDGAWDARYDGEKQKSFIMLDGKTLEVRFDPKRGPGARQKISLDGKHILFDTQRRKRPEIWIMNADGTNQRALVSDLKVIPMRTSWQPADKAARDG